ncbi:hypothetical protein BaRGS_00006062 [Batillaria attramentaria]|uniref:Uncharacterized protein n=1 Tax=Batillaria attramentaria TaxID=370345 RepID=A0ABD0LV57_9CAEN
MCQKDLARGHQGQGGRETAYHCLQRKSTRHINVLMIVLLSQNLEKKKKSVGLGCEEEAGGVGGVVCNADLRGHPRKNRKTTLCRKPSKLSINSVPSLSPWTSGWPSSGGII